MPTMKNQTPTANIDAYLGGLIEGFISWMIVCASGAGYLSLLYFRIGKL